MSGYFLQERYATVTRERRVVCHRYHQLAADVMSARRLYYLLLQFMEGNQHVGQGNSSYIKLVYTLLQYKAIFTAVKMTIFRWKWRILRHMIKVRLSYG